MTPAELPGYAWDRINEAVTTGALRLPNGRAVTLDDDQLVRLLQWLASLTPKQKRKVSTPEDFLPPVTGGGDVKKTAVPVPAG